MIVGGGLAGGLCALALRRRRPDLRLLLIEPDERIGGNHLWSFFDTDVADDDKVLTYGDVRVLVDSSSAVMLEGATLDFKDGLESGFSINNPNAQRTCGCGSSFS